MTNLATSTSSAATKASAAALAAATPVSLKDDVQVVYPPSDSVSSLAFSPTENFLAVGSWDCKVRLYQVAPTTGQTRGVCMWEHDAPVLNVAWTKDGSKMFAADCDGVGVIVDFARGPVPFQVARHDGPIKSMKWIETPHGGILATGGWDKTLRYWDLRICDPIAVVQLPERVYSMDARYPMLVVGTADRQMQLYDLTNPTVLFSKKPSLLNMQTRVVTCGDGMYAYGGVDGRVGMHWPSTSDPNADDKKFAFKAHRTRLPTDPATSPGSVVWAVNDIAFHPLYGTFATCGSDGSIIVWDGENRKKIKTFESVGGPITAMSFNRTGSMLAYAASYDWHKGHTGNVPSVPNKVMLHSCKDDEVKPQPATKTTA